MGRPRVARLQRSGQLDGALALLLCALAQLEVWVPDFRQPGPVALHAVLSALATLALAWRRRLPLLVAVVVAVAFVVETAVTAAGTPLAASLALLVAAWSLARYAPPEAAVGGGLVVLASSVAHDVIHPQVNEFDIALSALLCITVWVLGFALRRRDQAIVELRAGTARLLVERDRRAEAAAAAERARLARELHDIVAHGISVVAVQAGAARWVLDGDCPQVRGALETIERTSRESLAELRRLLEVLRDDEAQPADLTPQRGLADVPALVEQVRAAGQPVRLRMDRPAEPLPAGLDLTAYRIVQEAVTNVLKHAPGAGVVVVVRRLPDAVEVDVTDDGRGRPGLHPAGGLGHGLVGMRERVALYGGDLQAGPRQPSGFGVRARLPLPERR